MFDVLSALDGAVIVLGVMVYLGALVAIVLPDHRNPVVSRLVHPRRHHT